MDQQTSSHVIDVNLDRTVRNPEADWYWTCSCGSQGSGRYETADGARDAALWQHPQGRRWFE